MWRVQFEQFDPENMGTFFLQNVSNYTPEDEPSRPQNLNL